MVKPKFVKEIQRSGRTIKTFKTEVLNSSICSRSSIKKAKEILEGVVERGTAITLSKSAYKIAGKTGTAELRDKPAHAWFVGFAPYGARARKIAFAVLIENGRYGGRVAAPAAADIADAAAELGLIQGE